MTRILSYNILSGGRSPTGDRKRIYEIIGVIQSVQPDVVGLIEATSPQCFEDPSIVEEIASRLDMQAITSPYARHRYDHQVALLTRLPVVKIQVHDCPCILTKPVIEASVKEGSGQELTIFVAHLSAAFNQGRLGEHIRKREVQYILQLMSSMQGKSHVLIGDFNGLAPGDSIDASGFLNYLIGVAEKRESVLPLAGLPNLDLVIPKHLRFLRPCLLAIPQNKLLSSLFDKVLSAYIPRKSIELLLLAGYSDCFRQLHPRLHGFTYPSINPACRIDFIFASSEPAERLTLCQTVLEAGQANVCHASDHLAILAEFR